MSKDPNKPDINEAETETDIYTAYSEAGTKSENWLKWEEAQSQEYKEYRELWESFTGKSEKHPYPVHLDIEVSSRCNLKCTFCARTVRVEEGTWREIKDLDIDLFNKIIDEAAALGTKALNLNILGEPLLHRKIGDMIRYAKSKGIVDVFFHTNGMLLNKKKAKILIESGLDKLIVSFDSPYKKKFEAVRVGASYEKIIENVKEFHKIREEMGSITPVTRINFIKLPGVTDKEVEDMVELFDPIVDSIGLLDYVDPRKEINQKFDKDYVSKFICSQLLTRLCVYENGNVFPCCMDYDDQLLLGNLAETSVEEIWNGERLEEIRRLHKAGKFFEIPGCATCEFAIIGDRESREK